MKSPPLSIIVPTLDEGEVIGEFLRRLFRLPLAKTAQILIVDGGSSDSTRDVVQHWQKQKKNIEWLEAAAGKGAALRMGFGKAKAKDIIFIDADLQYPPEEIPKVARALSRYSLVCTRRLTNGYGHRRLLSLGFSHIIGKGLLSLPVSDPQSGLKGVKKSLLSRISLTSRHFELDAELISKGQAAGAKIKEIEIDFHPRTAGKTKTGLISTTANLLAGGIKLASSKHE